MYLLQDSREIRLGISYNRISTLAIQLILKYFRGLSDLKFLHQCSSAIVDMSDRLGKFLFTPPIFLSYRWFHQWSGINCCRPPMVFIVPGTAEMVYFELKIMDTPKHAIIYLLLYYLFIY